MKKKFRLTLEARFDNELITKSFIIAAPTIDDAIEFFAEAENDNYVFLKIEEVKMLD